MLVSDVGNKMINSHAHLATMLTLQTEYSTTIFNKISCKKSLKNAVLKCHIFFINLKFYELQVLGKQDTFNNMLFLHLCPLNVICWVVLGDMEKNYWGWEFCCHIIVPDCSMKWIVMVLGTIVYLLL